ncbi:hypothetical protein [Xanthomonas euvesicatoria]|uniref:hypothetical protein n=1 Tax=Xanthomonas euvesicatoria TaxID=456327 RepID=UPI001C436ABA|nr:hypothetical protein [Xanthomonas euvesicatoria]
MITAIMSQIGAALLGGFSLVLHTQLQGELTAERGLGQFAPRMRYAVEQVDSLGNALTNLST